MTYFKKRRALAGGLTVAGFSLGGVIFHLMVSHLLPEVEFGWTMRTCAFLILALWAITMATISSNLPHGGREFNISNYTRPFTEPKFLILLGFCYFLYCASIFCRFRGLCMLTKQRGSLRTFQLPCNLVCGLRNVTQHGFQLGSDHERCQLHRPHCSQRPCRQVRSIQRPHHRRAAVRTKNRPSLAV